MGYVSAAATIGAALLSSAGQYAVNQRNLQQQQRANSESINLANTAHQREVNDLLAAGLNPVLSTSGSGASVPALGVANQGNELSGLASGITSAGKLAAPAYRAGVEGQVLANEYQGIVNSAAADERAASAQESKNRLDLANLEEDGIQAFLGNRSYYDKKSGAHVVEHDKKQYSRAVELVREAVQSDIKLRANANWRANASSFVPFVSPAAINQGVNSARGMQMFRRFK